MGFFKALGNSLTSVPVVGDIVGGVANIASTAMTNKANKQIAREQNQFNLEQWNREADFTREMWNANNEYNDPSAQMQRLLDAGLSPWAAASAIGAGDAQSVATPSSSPAAGAQMAAPDFSFLSAATENVWRRYQEERKNDALIRTQDAEANLKEEQASNQIIKNSIDRQFGLAMAQSALDNSLYDQHNKKYDAALKLQSLENNATMFQLTQDYQRRQNTMLERSIKYQDLQNYAQEIENKMQDLRLGNLPKQLAAELALRFAEIDAQHASAGLSRAAAESQKASAAKEWLSAYGVKLDNDVAEKLSEIRVGTAAMQFLAPYEDYYGTNRHYNRAGKVLSPIVGMLGLGLGLYAGRGRGAMKGVKSFGRVGNGAFTQFE